MSKTALAKFNSCQRRGYPWDRESEARRGDYAYARTRVDATQNWKGLERGYEVALHFAKNIAAKRKDSEHSIEKVFREHADIWWKETRILSSIQAKIFNPHYQRIMAMGKPVLPFIFADLRDRGGQWYWALECITGENPAANAQTLPEAKRLWLEYATNHNYL